MPGVRCSARLIGAVLGVLIGGDPRSPAAVALRFGTCYAIERALAEVYKTFLRDEDQSKYAIPMQLSVLGRPVRSRLIRLLVGGLYVLGGVLVLTGIEAVGRTQRGATLGLALALGGAGGWISALGGAWKDAPIEGFQLFKFFRSPAMATGFALLLLPFGSSLAQLTLAATGFTIATIETWKTFAFPSSPRGKFAGKPIHYPDMLRRRRRLIPLYALIWVVVLAAVGAGLAGSATAGQASASQAPRG